MSDSAQIKELRSRMEKSLDQLHKEFSGLRTGRASTNMLEPVSVPAYGSRMPINQVGNVTAPEARLLVVTIWDQSLTEAADKAIRDSGLGLNPQTEGNVIRIPVPPLSEERRKELGKVAGKYAENARIAVRGIRRDGMDGVKKQENDKEISEDEAKRNSDLVQKLTDEYIKKIDETLAHKESEIMQV